MTAIAMKIIPLRIRSESKRIKPRQKKTPVTKKYAIPTQNKLHGKLAKSTLPNFYTYPVPILLSIFSKLILHYNRDAPSRLIFIHTVTEVSYIEPPWFLRIVLIPSPPKRIWRCRNKKKAGTKRFPPSIPLQTLFPFYALRKYALDMLFQFLIAEQLGAEHSYDTAIIP